MASFTISRADKFPSGTTVYAYPRSNWTTSQLPPSGSPQGSSTTSATAGASSVAFSGLADGTQYYAYAQVGGVDTYVGFATDAAVAGATSGASALSPTAVKTANYAAAASDLVPVDTTSGAVTITLPTAPADKAQVAVKLVTQGATNAVTIARGGSDVFNKAGGSTSLTLSVVNQAAVLQYAAGSGVWYVVSTDVPLAGLDTRYQATLTATGDVPGLTTALAGKAAPTLGWAASTAYVAGQQVTYGGQVYAAKTTFTSGTAFDPANWTLLGGPVAKRVRSTAFGGLPIIASGGMRVGGSATSTQLTGNSRRQFLITTAANEIRIVFPGYSYDTVDAAQQMTISAGIEYPLGTLAAPVFFGGKLSGVVDPGGVLISDPVAIDAAVTDAVYVRTFVTVPTTGGFPANYTSKASKNEGGVLAGTDLSKGTTGITSADGVGIYSPMCVVGIPNASTYPPVIALIGDSIMKGDLDPDEIGFSLRSLNDQFAWLDLSKGSETAQTFASKSGSVKRRRVLTACTHAMLNHGVNDLGGRTRAQIQADALTIATYCSTRDIRAFYCTITPRTSSTDSWATTANQTIQANEAKRTGFNDWVRDGAPIDATSKAAVAVGTNSNVLRAGAVGHPLVGWFDTGKYMEVNSSNVQTINGGFWKVTGAANFYTSDGLHPSTAGHILMVPGVDTTKFS